MPWTPLQQRATALGYGAALDAPRTSQQALQDWVDPFLAELDSGRRILWFDRLARPMGFGVRGRTPDAGASILTGKKDVLDHCSTRLRDLLALGEALLAMRAAPAYAGMPTGTAIAVATTLTGTGQYRLYRDAAGRPCGLLSWAWISPWTVGRLRDDIRAPLHPCEWSEGDQLHFRDLAVSRDGLDAICTDLGGGLFPAAAFCWVGLIAGPHDRGTLAKIAASQRCNFSNWLRLRVLADAAR